LQQHACAHKAVHNFSYLGEFVASLGVRIFLGVAKGLIMT